MHKGCQSIGQIEGKAEEGVLTQNVSSETKLAFSAERPHQAPRSWSNYGQMLSGEVLCQSVEAKADLSACSPKASLRKSTWPFWIEI